MEFDDLADEFMNGDSENTGNFDFNELILNYIKMLKEPSMFKNVDDLGEPTSIEIIKEDGYTFEKKTWETDSGKFITVDMVSINGNDESKSVELKHLTLLDELKQAELNEDYERCIKIRDMLKKYE